MWEREHLFVCERDCWYVRECVSVSVCMCVWGGEYVRFYESACVCVPVYRR